VFGQLKDEKRFEKIVTVTSAVEIVTVTGFRGCVLVVKTPEKTQHWANLTGFLES